MAEQSICKGCGAPIVWAVTEHGKRIPLNKPEKRFLLFAGTDTPHVRDRALMTDTYTSHFATCPKADEFRKEKG